jgi:hypothetical protein
MKRPEIDRRYFASSPADTVIMKLPENGVTAFQAGDVGSIPIGRYRKDLLRKEMQAGLSTADCASPKCERNCERFLE